MSENYKATVKACTKELTPIERIAIKDTKAMVNIMDYVEEVEAAGNQLKLVIDYVAILDVHNPKSDNPDYEIYVFAATSGIRYYTSSQSLYQAVKEIAEELQSGGMQLSEVEIMFYRRESANYKGKHFLTASIVI